MRRKVVAPGRRLHAQAACSVAQLVALTGLTRFVVRGLLDSYGVQVLRSGRKMLVPLTEIEDKVPLLWKNLWRMEGLRAGSRGEDAGGGGERARFFGNGPVIRSDVARISSEAPTLRSHVRRR